MAIGADQAQPMAIRSVRRQGRRWHLIMPVAATAYLAVGIATHATFAIINGSLLLLVLIADRLLPSISVSAAGIKRPLRLRRRMIGWPEVDAVTTDPASSQQTLVLLYAGDRVELAGIAASQAAVVAAIGHRPLRSQWLSADAFGQVSDATDRASSRECQHYGCSTLTR